MRMMAIFSTFLIAGEASAHPGTSHALAHNAEHLLLLSLILAPALLLVRPVIRLFVPGRRR